MIKLYVFDMDGTLADCGHRLHFVKGNHRPDYDAFYKACVSDTPIQWTLDLLKEIRHNWILILTGRSEVARKDTHDWLINNGVLYDYLIMRPDKNYEQDHILKPRMLEDFLRDKNFQVQFIIDDRTRVVEAFRYRGYNVLQCQKGDY